MQIRNLIFGLLMACSAALHAQLDTTRWYSPTYAYGASSWCFSPANTTVAGGYLVETTSYGTDICGYSGADWQGTMIVSTPFYFDFGRIVVRGRVAGYGVHSTAPWLWGGLNPSSGYPATCIAALKAGGAPMAACANAAKEIDGCEYQPNSVATTSVANSFNTWVSGTPTYNYHHVSSLGFDASATIYNCEIDVAPAGVTYKVNGAQTGSYSTTLTGYFWFVLIDQEIDPSAPPSSSGSYPQTGQFQYAYFYCTSDTTVPSCTPGQLIPIDNFTAGTGAVQSQGVTKGVVQ